MPAGDHRGWNHVTRLRRALGHGLSWWRYVIRSCRLDGPIARFDRAPRSRVSLPAVVRQLRARSPGVGLMFAFSATSAQPQTDDKTR